MTPLHESLEILPDARALARRAATRVADWIAASPTPVRVALAGGNTPRDLYRVLAADPFRSRIPWERVEIYWGDERLVPGDHPESNFRMARETLLARAPIPPQQVHPMVPASETELGGGDLARRYEEILGKRFGVTPPHTPRFDLILLGMGNDGHTASLFPSTPALAEQDRWVVSVPAPTHIAPHLPRITLTPPVLLAARRVMVLVSGAAKADTLRLALEGPHNPVLLPIQIARERTQELVWLLDADAAAKLNHAEMIDRESH